MKFEVISDLHLEKYSTAPKIIPKADYLILAGDIGHIDSPNFKEFFDRVEVSWKKSFYVLGNHEYYSAYEENMDKLVARYESFFDKYENVYLMNRSVATLHKVIILGCTLWSNMKKYLPEINDFKNIYKQDRRLSYREYVSMHRDDLNWLKQNYDPNIPTIIITHFPIINDSRSVNPNFERNVDRDSYFYNNIRLDITENGSETLCISGHTHWSFDFKINDVRYFSNQVGNIDENTGYSQSRTVTFPENPIDIIEQRKYLDSRERSQRSQRNGSQRSQRSERSQRSGGWSKSRIKEQTSEANEASRASRASRASQASRDASIKSDDSDAGEEYYEEDYDGSEYVEEEN